MSLRVKIPGHVKLNPKQAKKVGLFELYECHIFRNYTLIKDGNLNMKRIMCLVPNKKITSKSLGYPYYIRKDGIQYYSVSPHIAELIDNEKYNRFTIDLTEYPLINQMYIDELLHIEMVFDIHKRMLELECRQKILNDHLKDIKIVSHLKKEGVFKELTRAQIDLLEEHGISKDGVYSGVSREIYSTGDVYTTRILKFYFAGISSLPPISQMLERIDSGKKLTAAMEFLKVVYDEIENEAKFENIDFSKKIKKTKEWLDIKLERMKIELNNYRDRVALLKMAIVLTGSWFTLEVDEKNNYYYEKDGMKLICKTDYKEVKI